jgi:hypothetical protein
VNHQSMIYAVWLGVAVLAFVWANLHLWHTRRLLGQTQREVSSLADRRVPAAATDTSISRVAS